MKINKIEDFDNPQKAAKGTALILALRYNNEIKNKLKGELQSLLANTWNKGEEYSNRIKKAKRFINLQQLN